ncbi:hypothetical protein K502DRAFT_341019 [Neoconidiobolus thromboides FSU 785]|nr:hypothetical protein K502DRAFT_341019 [Neoconidiobolus thromboides FSU 785]
MGEEKGWLENTMVSHELLEKSNESQEWCKKSRKGIIEEVHKLNYKVGLINKKEIKMSEVNNNDEKDIFVALFRSDVYSVVCILTSWDNQFEKSYSVELKRYNKRRYEFKFGSACILIIDKLKILQSKEKEKVTGNEKEMNLSFDDNVLSYCENISKDYGLYHHSELISTLYKTIMKEDKIMNLSTYNNMLEPIYWTIPPEQYKQLMDSVTGSNDEKGGKEETKRRMKVEPSNFTDKDLAKENKKPKNHTPDIPDDSSFYFPNSAPETNAFDKSETESLDGTNSCDLPIAYFKASPKLM